MYSLCPLAGCWPGGNLHPVCAEGGLVQARDSHWETELHAQCRFCLMHPEYAEKSLGLHQDTHFAQNIPSRKSKSWPQACSELLVCKSGLGNGLKHMAHELREPTQKLGDLALLCLVPADPEM